MKKLLVKTVLVLCLVVLLALISVYRYAHPGRGPRVEVDANAKGYAEEVEGTIVIHVKGSPYEMGYQHGFFGREYVQLAMVRFADLLDEAKEEFGMPRFGVEFLLDFIYARCALHIPDRYERELEGLADGAEVDLQMLRRFQVISVVTERACSVFSVFGEATGNGKVYHGRNFDWVMDAGLQDCAGLILYEPDGQIPFASAGYIGSVGLVSGMNMEGIAIGQIGAISDDSSYSGIPLMLLMRQVLEEAGNLDEATQLIQSAKRTVGYNYVLADGDDPGARAYETSANHCVVFTDNDPKEAVEYALPMEDAVFRSDEAMDPTVRGFQRCANAPDLPYGSNSYDHRYKGMATRFEERYGSIDEQVALEVLKAVAMRNVNLHGVLCNCTDREMWVAHAKGTEDAWKQDYVHYDLKQLFLRPEERQSKAN